MGQSLTMSAVYGYDIGYDPEYPEHWEETYEIADTILNKSKNQGTLEDITIEYYGNWDYPGLFLAAQRVSYYDGHPVALDLLKGLETNPLWDTQLVAAAQALGITVKDEPRWYMLAIFG